MPGYHELCPVGERVGRVEEGSRGATLLQIGVQLDEYQGDHKPVSSPTLLIITAVLSFHIV